MSHVPHTVQSKADKVRGVTLYLVINKEFAIFRTIIDNTVVIITIIILFHWSRGQNPPYIQSLSSPQPCPQHSGSATTSFINIYFKLSILDINFFGRSTTIVMLLEMSCDNVSVRSIFCSNQNNMYYVKCCVFYNNF